MSKGQKQQRVTCEAFVDGVNGHLILFAMEDGQPVVYRQFKCARKYRNDQGRFDARGFRNDADKILEFVTHPDEEIVVSKPNCTPERYTKLTVGSTKKTSKYIENAMKKDRDSLLEHYGISKEEAKEMGARRARKRGFVEWLFETETEEQHAKRIAAKKAAKAERKAARKAEKAKDKAAGESAEGGDDSAAADAKD